MENLAKLQSNAEIRPLQESELNAVSGGYFGVFLAVAAAGILASRPSTADTIHAILRESYR